MCAYKPPARKSGFTRGPQGAAIVAMSPDGKKVKVTFEDTNIGEFKLDRSVCPDVLVKGKCFVGMSGDKDKILSARPLNGVVRAKVKEFVSEKDKEPAPKVNAAAKYPYSYFTVLLEVVKGAWKGAIIPVHLHYNFCEFTDEQGRAIVGFDKMGSKTTPPLVEFFDVTGVWNKGPMPYKDNLLPLIAKRIKEVDAEFDVVMKNGYADSYIAIDEVGLESEPIPDE